MSEIEVFELANKCGFALFKSEESRTYDRVYCVRTDITNEIIKFATAVRNAAYIQGYLEGFVDGKERR